MNHRSSKTLLTVATVVAGILVAMLFVLTEVAAELSRQAESSLSAENFASSSPGVWERIADTEVTGHSVVMLGVLLLVGFVYRGPVRCRPVWVSALAVGLLLLVHAAAVLTTSSWRELADRGAASVLLAAAYVVVMAALWRGLDAPGEGSRQRRQRSRPGRRIGIGILREDE